MAARGLFIDGGYLLPAGEAEFSSESRYVLEGKAAAMENNSNNFPVDDLLNFSVEDEVMADTFFDSVTGDSSTVTGVDSCNSSISGGGGNFNGNLGCRSFTDAPFPPPSEICVPYEDLAELEWLSNIVEDSFSSDELQNLHLISATKTASTAAAAAASNITDTLSSVTNIAPKDEVSPPAFRSDVSVPGKARSKRSRTAPCDWSSRLLHLSSPATSSSDSNCSTAIPRATKTAACKRRENSETPGRKCLHCASEKTPQWRTGPLGPKTLCNACGVRYKSGRLVAEYRPAASPTFESNRHSNSHRKVLELRRQKDLRRQHHQLQQQQHQSLISQASIFGISNGAEDYLLHHHHHLESGCPDFRHII
ncbi:PREDICTED: GATA transcription factor 9-like [Ipomoea nil]|uniref:GATA transcription factor 9-like n=1 Tax=Ipomoea nil TaxID=35883 RepID=UPI0009013F20|nr:PREDICTED: GATA transcription factor 9-like [Ipomoea nil]